MKKIISLLLVLCLCFSLTACSNNDDIDTFEVTLKSGTVEKMTHKQLSDLYNNSLKLEDYLGAEVIGSGKLKSVKKATNGTATIAVGVLEFEIKNVPLDVAKTFNTDDVVDVKGKLTNVFGSIVYLDGNGYY